MNQPAQQPSHAVISTGFALGDGWVVADPTHDRLLVLNATARLIWDLWQQGQDPRQIARTLASRYDVEPAQADADVHAAIAGWQSTAHPGTVAQTPDWRWPTQDQLAELPVAAAASQCTDYCIHTTPIRVHFGTPAIRRAVAPLLDHLTTSASAETATDYHIEPIPDGYRLRQARRVIYQGPSLHLAAVILLHESQLAAYRERDNLCVLHAAAVGLGDTCILLPGSAGAGKSTLTAALLHSGFEYLSDDTVPIDAASLCAVPLSPPLCIKAGSAEVLRSRYPQLPELPVYQRADQPVRYLPPPAASLATRHERPVRALVFPHYQPGSDARLTEIPTTQAFASLVEAGISAHRPRDPAHLGALIEWFDGLRSYALHYDDLDAACRRIHEVFGTGKQSLPQQHSAGSAPARTGP